MESIDVSETLSYDRHITLKDGTLYLIHDLRDIFQIADPITPVGQLPCVEKLIKSHTATLLSNDINQENVLDHVVELDNTQTLERIM